MGRLTGSILRCTRQDIPEDRVAIDEILDRSRCKCRKVGSESNVAHAGWQRAADRGHLFKGEKLEAGVGKPDIEAARKALIKSIAQRRRNCLVQLEHKVGMSAPSTIHGNRQRGTGILNNELYIGKLVWNRLRYIKDPETGKRVSRLNPESAWITQDVADLRIISDDLWQAVKARQEENKADWDTSGLKFWDRKRPRYLFSGLMSCGVCGGGIVNINAVRVGCANARNKATCTNRQTMRRDTLEAIVLDGLREHLMEPELFALFCDEYTRHMNALRIEATAALAGYRSELAKVTRDIERLISAILDGVGGAQVKDRMAALEARKEELERLLSEQDEPVTLLHPNMAAHYRQEVAKLHSALTDEKHRVEAVEIIRSLVDRIVLTLDKDGKRKTMAVDLQGHLAGILSLAAQTKKPPQEGGSSKSMKLVAGRRSAFDRLPESTKLVAGVGFEPTTFRL